MSKSPCRKWTHTYVKSTSIAIAECPYMWFRLEYYCVPCSLQAGFDSEDTKNQRKLNILDSVCRSNAVVQYATESAYGPSSNGHDAYPNKVLIQCINRLVFFLAMTNIFNTFSGQRSKLYVTVADLSLDIFIPSRTLFLYFCSGMANLRTGRRSRLVLV